MNIYMMLSVGVGGFIGAISRASLNNLITGSSSLSHIPWGTLSVNLIGSFLIGALFIVFEKINVSQNIELLLITGLLGALTTYSTFSMETFLLIKDNLILYAILNILLNTIGTLICTGSGYYLVGKMIK